MCSEARVRGRTAFACYLFTTTVLVASFADDVWAQQEPSVPLPAVTVEPHRTPPRRPAIRRAAPERAARAPVAAPREPVQAPTPQQPTADLEIAPSIESA